MKLSPEEAELIKRLVELGWQMGANAWLPQDDGSELLCDYAIGKGVEV